MIPENRIFRDTVVKLADEVDELGVISEVVFERCLIVGPAVVAIEGVQFRSTSFGLPNGQSIEAILWPPPASHAVWGCIGMRACLFEHCEFQQVGFTGTTETLDLIRTLAP